VLLVVLAMPAAVLPVAPLAAQEAQSPAENPQADEASKARVVVFPFEIDVERQMDMMMRGEATEAEIKRLEIVTDKLRELLEKSGEYELVSYEPVAEELKDKQPLFKCNGCDADLAKALGAGQAITGTVTKASPTLINISLFLRDAGSGEVVKSMAVSVRQNTDAGWSRGVRWLVRNRLLKGAS
jgi:hypothetical protein